jgi:hypothetical protein
VKGRVAVPRGFELEAARVGMSLIFSPYRHHSLTLGEALRKMNVDTQQGTSSKGKGKGKGKDKRENQVQADKVPRKTKKKEEEIKMDVWLQLPQELILEIFRFVVASKSNWLHDKCITHCKKSTLASKIALKEQYEKGASIEEYTFFNLEDVLGCPIWGVGHLSQLKVNIELRHCECTLGSDLHTRLNKPSKITIGQLTLIDEGVKLRRYRKMMFGARIVVKDFGNPKYLKAKKKENAESDSEDDTDDDGDVEVCYHDGW